MPVSTGKLFIWFLVLTDDTRATISCGEKANISDAVSLALWPLSPVPQGRICLRTGRGRSFPLGRGGKLPWLTLIAREKHQQVKRWSHCSVCMSAPELPNCPSVLTTKKCITLAAIQTWLLMCVFYTVGDFCGEA